MPSLCATCGWGYATPGQATCGPCRDHARLRIRANKQAQAHRTRWHQMSAEARAKANVRRKANHAQAYGVLEPQPCQRCGYLRAQKHHPDYKQPLSVEWLCTWCHSLEHARATA